MKTLFLLVLAASAAAQPFAWPPGYFNARTATDAAKPRPGMTPGELRVTTTHHSIGVEWDVEGDTDHDAACTVSYRLEGGGQWREALPLLRVDYAGWYDKHNALRPFNMLAGSVMFLQPGAAYEVKLTLSDPDNTKPIEQVKRVRMKPWPAFKPARRLHVVPKGDGGEGDGSKDKPFQGMQAALRAARPGDLFLLRGGEYGAVSFEVSGEAGDADPAADTTRYIGFKAAGSAPAVFTQIGTRGNHLWLEGLSLKRGESPNGLRANGPCENIVVKRCTFRGLHYSILLNKDCRGWHIADNDITGDTEKGISGECVELNHSSGHTVCHNRMDRSADGVSYPHADCDIFGNDIVNMSDDPVEPDYGYANNRIWGNRLHGHSAITFQPMYCGPWYIVRNHCISRGNTFKLRVQDRFVCVNNTFAAHGTAVPHAHGLLSSFCRNNVWMHLGGSEALWTCAAPEAEKYRGYNIKYVVYDSPVANWKTDVDYDGFEFSAATPHPKLQTPNPWNWLNRRFFDLPGFSAAIGIEQHGVVLDRSRDFLPFEVTKDMPGAQTPFIRLSEASAAKDAGVPVPNLSDHFEGKAPDLGAFEIGRSIPHYGPRRDDAPAVEWISAFRGAVQPQEFEHAGILAAWEAYKDVLSFGKGQTLALLDDGCDMTRPEWQGEKVRVTFDAVDGDNDPKHEGRGYHGTTIGIPSSVNHGGRRGVAFNNQLAIVRSLECCHCKIADSASLAKALQWVIDHHAEHHITTVNLAPVDDQQHAEPVPTEIDAKLAKLRELGIWVSAPAGNHGFTKSISWPASQPNCFAIGAVTPGGDVVTLDRSAKIDLLVPARATSSSNAILCGSAMLLREAIEKSGYDWKKDGADLASAMMKIFQTTGVEVKDGQSGLSFRRLDLMAALEEVMPLAR
ncbi:MAG: S8 family serine peptidase [Verrucomicrobiaceae bacterium]|nr:S8 family serine peptidase [Verrucomicrobiaceae bacterium]